MHLLLSKGYEDGESSGLNFFNGYVDKIPVKNKKLPNIGWRKVKFSDNKNFSFLKKFDNSKFYFVHSYMSNVNNEESIISHISYDGIKIPSMIFQKNVIGIQFHPEKSGKMGHRLIKNFLKLGHLT